MGLLGATTQESYYNQSQTFTGDGSTTTFVLTSVYFPVVPDLKSEFEVFINNVLITSSNYSYSASNDTLSFTNSDINSDVQTSTGAPILGYKIIVREVSDTEQYGSYQFIKIEDIINNFMVSYVGENTFFSAYFTKVGSGHLFGAISHHIFTTTHHGLNFFIQFF